MPPLWQGSVLAVISVGGALGACARRAADVLWPTAADGFPWATFGVNAVGCALMGAFMVLATEVRRPHRLVRPFVGTGVLGGFTTFSTYAVGVQRLTERDHVGLATAYLAATPVTAVACVWGATVLTRWAASRAGGQGPSA
ncbi:MAG TPA: CrcB family protein [Yinghuangia sp.]|nr:CrcB family protein [Yinghuangia sp.]